MKVPAILAMAEFLSTAEGLVIFVLQSRSPHAQEEFFSGALYPLVVSHTGRPGKKHFFVNFETLGVHVWRKKNP